MQEPVKLVVIVEGGVVQDIMSCGVPCDVALIDYDVDGDDDTVEINEGEQARVSVWNLRSEQGEAAAASELFDIVSKAVTA